MKKIIRKTVVGVDEITGKKKIESRAVILVDENYDPSNDPDDTIYTANSAEELIRFLKKDD